MTKLVDTLHRVLADPLQGLRPTGGGVGYVGADVPLDVLLATGRPVAHLPWIPDRPTPRADAWLESSFPGWARSMLEDWAQGQFDCFDEVVFSRGEDAVQRLYYYVCELQRRGLLGGPRPMIFDIARIPRESSLRHTHRSVRRLCEGLGVDDAALSRGIDRCNLRRALYARVEAGRQGDGALYALIARASLHADLDAVLAADAWPVARPVRGRVLLAGSVPPDERLHRAVERTGWSITGEQHECALTRLGPPIPRDADPTAAVAAQRHAARHGPRGFGDPTEALREAVDRSRARAVLLWLTREDEALAWHVPAQRASLAAAGIPALILTARQWDADDGALTEIKDFFEALQ